jgi:multidrug efflux pump subunit AcrA (membrane-fusion protein)
MKSVQLSRNCWKSLILAGLLLSSLAVSGCSDRGTAAGNNRAEEIATRTVAVAPVVTKDFERNLQATGTLTPKEAARLRALVEGPLESIYVDIGDRVRRGQPLFRARPIDSELMLQSAEARLQTARAHLNDLISWRRPEEVASLRAQLAGAQAEYERLKSETERADALLEKGALSKSHWEATRTSTEAARARLRVAEEQLRIAEKGPTPEQLEVAKRQVAEAEASRALAGQTYEDTTVRAPFSGVITGRYRKSGDFARRGDEILEITNLDVLEAEIQIPERYAPLVKTGLPVQLRAESQFETLLGEIVAVNQAIDIRTRTFLVKVRVANTDHRIKAGSFTVGSFRLPAAEQALAVPLAALHTDEGRSFVWLAEKGKAKRAIVQTGERDDEHIQIQEGLNPGDQVIIAGAGGLAEGDPLEVQS